LDVADGGVGVRRRHFHYVEPTLEPTLEPTVETSLSVVNPALAG
jgi:hypothetical protein